MGDNFSSMDSIKLIVNDEDFQKLYEEQAEAYGGVSSMASMEMDVYLPWNFLMDRRKREISRQKAIV